MWAISVLARKAKEAAAQKLKDEVMEREGDPVGELLKEAKAGTLKRRAKGEIFEKVKSTSALQVVAEYKTKFKKNFEIPPLTIVSKEVRDSGAVALALNMDGMTGGCSPDDVRAAVTEQSVAKNDFPGPLPVIWTDIVVAEVQLAQAASFGATAITLDAGNNLADLRQKALNVYGLEPLITVAKDDTMLDRLQGLLFAFDDEAATFLVTGFGTEDVDLAKDLVDLCSSHKAAIVIRIEANDDQGLDEAELAWKFRDVGVDAVWASDVLYKFGQFSGVLYAAAPDSITSVIKAMRSKASSTFARAAGAFSGKGEGAKEYLGDLLM